MDTYLIAHMPRRPAHIPTEHAAGMVAQAKITAASEKAARKQFKALYPLRDITACHTAGE